MAGVQYVSHMDRQVAELQIAAMHERAGVILAELSARPEHLAGLLTPVEPGAPPRYGITNPALQARLDVAEARVGLFNNAGALIATSGDLHLTTSDNDMDWYAKLHRTLSDIRYRRNPPWVDENGFIPADLFAEASEFGRSSTWHRIGQAHILRIIQPLRVPGLQVGYLTIDTRAAALSDINRSAMARAMLYTSGAFLVTVAGLLSYASWLSWRIVRLSRKTASVLAGPQSAPAPRRRTTRRKGTDELAELGHQYGLMVERIDNYTRYLESLSSKLSHEIRTPIAIVRSSLENLEQASDSQSRALYTQRASEGIGRLTRILSAMSEATALESAIDSASREAYCPADVLQSLIEAYRQVYPAAEFSLNLNGQDLEKVNGSADLFAQMLDKLVDNAVDFSTGTIALGLYGWDDKLVLSVANPGPALPESMQGNLFDSLVSVRESGAKSRPHLGLGLHIVKRIASFHDGDVAAMNLPDGSGVEFRVIFPRLVSTDLKTSS